MERLSAFEGYSIRFQSNFILRINMHVLQTIGLHTSKNRLVLNCTSVLEKNLNSSFPSNKRLSNFACPEQVLVYFCFDLSSQTTCTSPCLWPSENEELLNRSKYLHVSFEQTALLLSPVTCNKSNHLNNSSHLIGKPVSMGIVFICTQVHVTCYHLEHQ